MKVTLVALLVRAATAEIGLAAIMAGAWGVQRLTGVSGWIDAIWTLGVGAMGVTLAIGFGAPGDGASWRAGTVAIFAAGWSLRLSLHIVARTIGAGDDPRYRKLMQDRGKSGPRRLFVFLQVQAVAGAVLALAIGLAGSAPGAGPPGAGRAGRAAVPDGARRRGHCRRPDRALQGGSGQSPQDLRRRPVASVAAS